jgi:hypothetical protein
MRKTVVADSKWRTVKHMEVSQLADAGSVAVLQHAGPGVLAISLAFE